MVIGLFPVKPDINWFCSSTVVDGGISNKASQVGRGYLFSHQESQTREQGTGGDRVTCKTLNALLSRSVLGITFFYNCHGFFIIN